MLELLKSLVFAVIMVPVVMAIILGAIYGLGEVFNIFSNVGHRKQPKKREETGDGSTRFRINSNGRNAAPR